MAQTPQVPETPQVSQAPEPPQVPETPEMISPEEALELVLSHVNILGEETLDLLDALGRPVAANLTSDIDITPFAHSAMDGFALHSADIEKASEDAPVHLEVIAEVAAGDWFEGTCTQGQCVRIMTGAAIPNNLDAVVKYEVVGVVSGDGKAGSTVSFSAPAAPGANIRAAGEEAHAGDVIIKQGEIIKSAGVGFAASCGIVRVPVYKRPHVAIIATGSELVSPTEVPSPGKIRNSNSFAMAACVQVAGGIPDILPAVPDTFDGLKSAVENATSTHDFVITTGGAANGDFDFIKSVVASTGELLMTTVNMRPGKAQTFGIVNGTPVFGLPGNPAAAYVGFEMLIRPALRKMQGYSSFEHLCVCAQLIRDVKKKDPRRIYLRATLTKDDRGIYIVEPAKNQSSGLFGVIQQSNCLAIMPEGLTPAHAGDEVKCVLLDMPEELAFL